MNLTNEKLRPMEIKGGEYKDLLNCGGVEAETECIFKEAETECIFKY